MTKILDISADQATAQVLSADDALEECLFESISQGIETQGYAILPSALPNPLCESLLDYLAQLEQDNFRPAGVGRRQSRMRNQFVRRDSIAWIDETHSGSGDWLAWATRLRLYLNRRLFLGLFSFESHFSVYHSGDFYRTHVDAFKGESNRVLSLVAYLNKGWEPGQGGELQLYAPESQEELLKVVPTFGTVVVFLSEEFPHEVLVTSRDRYAVAGWFRVNTSLHDAIDPPR